MRTNRLLLLVLASLLLAPGAFAQRQLEHLGRGVIAMRSSSSQVYIGWRMLGTDPADVSFNLYRVQNGVTNLLNGSPLTISCNYVDTPPNFSVANEYFVRPIIGGVEQSPSASWVLPANAPVRQYLNIPLSPPPGGTAYDGAPYIYTANDCSAGDVDGDGEYEIILKWDPSNSHDNSQSGFTGDTYLDCYKLDGTRLWRINLGPNIRSGAHYMDFMVFDYDGDGKAEMMCRTAPGSKDGLGNYVGGAAKWQNANGTRPSFSDTHDYRFDNPNANTTNGYVLAGPEFLTVFNGLTGEEMATATFNPHRDPDNNNDNPTASRINTVWGDSYGNRLDRFLAGVAFCDGVRPSAIFCRGYYTRAYLTAWDWRNGQLSIRWKFNSDDGNPANLAYKGQGAHSLTIGDVDGDGKDEITYGAAVIDDDGKGLYSTGLGHGDAEHLSDMDPNRPGLEVWMVHESPSAYGPTGEEYRDARTGALIVGLDGQNSDVGRGVAIDIDPRYPGYEMWGSRPNNPTVLLNATGVVVPTARPSSMNFACWWDGDLLREILDGTTISKWNWTSGTTSALLSPGGLASNNSTKSTPCLSGDLFGDWREEVIWRTSDNLNLQIYTTTIVATNRFYTLMHDPQYRCAIAWQNTGYNQPPHPGFNIGPDMYPPPLAPISYAQLSWRGGNGGDVWTTANNWFLNGVWTNDVAASFSTGNSVLFDLRASNHTNISISGIVTPGDLTVYSASNFIFSGSGSLAGAAQLFKAGPGRLTIGNTNNYSGGTFVSGGQLIVNGALNSSPVTVEARGEPWGRAKIGGGGQLGQGLTVQRDCGVIVGPGLNAAGTLTVSNGMTEQGGALNQFDLSNNPGGANNDRINIIGNLTLTGTNTIEIAQLNGSLGGGVYPLITYSGALSGGLNNLVLIGSFLQSVALTNPPGMIALVAMVPSAPPNAPSSLTATPIGAFQINLAWADNSADEIGFLLERSTGNPSSFSQIASLAPDTTAYQDLGRTPNTTYYYRVVATNLAGISAYSNTNNATTAFLPPLLTWRGDGSGNAWDLAGTPNWSGGGSLVVFNDTTDVLFDQSGSNNTAISLVGTLQPDTVTIDATKNYSFSGTGTLAGGMSLAKSGSGNLTLGNASGNSFTGGVVINAGTLTLGAANTIGAGPVTLLSNATLVLGTLSLSTANPLTISGTPSLTGGNGGGLTDLNDVSGSGVLNLTVTTGVLDLQGNLGGFNGKFAFTGGNIVRFYGSTGSASTEFDLGTGSLNMNKRSGAGTITLGALSGGTGTTLQGSSGGGNTTATTYSIGGKNISTTFQGTIVNGQGTTGVTKTGTGTLTLTGTNTYTGVTTVSGGTLIVNGDHSAATGSLTVNNNATLGGNGIIGSSTIVNGKLAPGTSIGTLTFKASLTCSSSSTAQFEISKSPFAHDQVVVLGNLVLGGTLDVVNTSVELLAAGDSFQLFNSAAISGSFSNFFLPALDDGLIWVTDGLTVNGRITVIVDTNPPPPFISNVAVAPRVTSAVITWETPADATSQVEYGLTTNYNWLTPQSSRVATLHSVLLTGLAPDTNYYFRAISRISATNAHSSPLSFATAGSLIVDNPEASYAGNWTLGTSGLDKFGSYYQYTLSTSGAAPSAEATYVPNIVASGQYDVFIWYPASSAFATNTPVSIYYNGGLGTYAVNQTTNGGTWRVLATALDFAAGTNGFAVIGNNTGTTNQVSVADAMRWSYSLAQDNPAYGTVPAWWADFYFHGVVDGAIDSDGDGLSNYAEYIFGTDPTDATSHLQLAFANSGSGFQLTFAPLVGGRAYQLATTTNLNTGTWAFLPNAPAAAAGTGVFPISNSTTPGPQFYRLGVRLSP